VKLSKLSIELVPSSAWFSNVRDIVSKAQWDIIRKQVYSAAYDVCEICGGVGAKHPVEAHEIWSYNEASGIQKLEKILALCPSCHQVKHIGLAQLQGKLEQAIKHFMKINGVKRPEALSYIESQFKIWEERSKLKWILDLEELSNYGIDITKLTLKK
jgi:hypothetical protein